MTLEIPVLQDTGRLSVLESNMAGALLTAFADKWSNRMLICAVEESRTVEEISEKHGIPLSTCYRRVRELVDAGLIIVERIVITKTGKRYALYRSSFRSFEVSVDKEGVEVRGEVNQEVAEKVKSRWLSITYPKLCTEAA
jgi:predicted transcriptional regulator